ncbi:hypothetical protein KUL156_54080 [Alteromonas sp. KUL156]|nr:hypothetical protein KUL154_10690 [Alteromonas sp. KUL154]GFE02816.1 hypothetical protein KUL156_54080 [Alteromonas sp. KUL156]
MVTVKNYEFRENSKGEKFLVLVLEGSVMPIRSKSGKVYFSAKRATVPCSMDEEACKSIIGSTFPGDIVKKEVPEYDFVIPETKETIKLTYKWEYFDSTLEEINEQLVSTSEVL